MSFEIPLHLIPIGEENAIPSKAIWKAQDRVWTSRSIKMKLNNLVKAGIIERKYVASNTGSQMSVYFRKSGE